jgi:transcription elongation factor GreA-like protein/transcription elongation GreA/GreB family factor
LGNTQQQRLHLLISIAYTARYTQYRRFLKMEYLKQFQKHIFDNQFAPLISLWQEYSFCDEVDPSELKAILVAVSNSPFATSFGKYAEDILPLWEKLPEGDEKRSILRHLVDLQTTNSMNLRSLVDKEISKHYETDPNYPKLLKILGGKERPSYQGILTNLELLTHLKPKNFCYHTKGWGVGEVLDVSFVREQVSCEFDFVAQKKDLSLSNALHCLIPLPKTHFLSMRFGSPDQLEQMARKEPVEVIKKLLKDLGPKNAQEIKEEMADLVIPESEWQKWWQLTRNKMKKDPQIHIPATLHEPFRLATVAISFEDRLIHQLEERPDADTLIEMVYSFLRDFPQAIKNQDFKEKIRAHLADALVKHELSDGQELSLFFILEDLYGETESRSIEALIKKAQLPVQILDQIQIISFKKRYMVCLEKFRDDSKNLFKELLLKVDLSQLREFLLNSLVKRGFTKEVEEVIEKLIHSPDRHAEAFLWFFETILKSTTLPYADKLGNQRLFEALFTLLCKVENFPLARDITKKIHGFITGQRFQLIRNLFQHCSVAELKELLLLSTKCQSLTSHELKTLRSLAEVVHPSLASAETLDDETVIWTTEAGYNKIKKRIEQIVQVDTLENAKEIEIARSYGDLRENSEFKFALEKRDRLQHELRSLSKELNHLRILTEEDINATRIGVGVQFIAEGPNHERILFKILGPHDADADHHILSYKSKFAKELEGRRDDDTFEMNGKTYTIKNIQSCLSLKERG